MKFERRSQFKSFLSFLDPKTLESSSGPARAYGIFESVRKYNIFDNNFNASERGQNFNA